MKNKNKIRKSIADRFKITKKGKVIYRSNFNSHLASSKSDSQLRRLARPKQLETKLAKKIRKLLGK